jgi:acetyl-CoA synthase
MSKLICTDAIEGARDIVARADALLAQTIADKGADHPVGFAGTAYYLPIIYSFTGRKVEKLGDMMNVMQDCHNLLPAPPADNVWLPYLGDTLDAGAATLFAFEVIEACKTLGDNPTANGFWLGAANDVIMRERGVEFVDGTAPGFAAIVGAAPDSKTAVKIARELQEKNLYIFMSGNVDGVTFSEQLESEGVQLGWETRLVPFGPDMSSAVYALGFANRAALSFGGVAPGDFEKNLRYNQHRIYAFVLALGEVDQEKYATAAGAINYGFPTIADTDIPEILPTGVCTYEHVVSNVPLDKIVEKALEVRGCKVKITKVPIPGAYGPAFEGERIRKADVHAEFGGNKTLGFEFVESVGIDEINDGEIEIIGPDIDTVDEGTAMPLAIWVQVAGRKMQSDFEPILERQIHHLVNGAEGVWHMGQRDIIWTRVSKGAYTKGFRLKHYGEIIHAKFLNEYPAIVDKVRVTLITDETEVAKRLEHARKVYVERNHRLAAMTDESVDTFYSCLLCQSFAPDHVCVITPERLGLCGAYNWLDGKAAFEIDETGPNQPVPKGECLDAKLGVWSGVNDYVYKNSHKALDSFCAYSIMSNPMTSCGCFEAIVAYVPECNGVMIVNREFMDDTPTGMTFSTLAGMVGGGAQTPGFMGVGKAFLSSRKFLAAEGGIQRIVWMPKELKDTVGEDIKALAEAAGTPDLLDLIADESTATEPDAIRAFMEKTDHPALAMQDMEEMAAEAEQAMRNLSSATDTAPKEKPVVKTAPKAAPKVVQIQAKQTETPAPVPRATSQTVTAPSVAPEPAVPMSGGGNTPADLMAALFTKITNTVTDNLKKTLVDEVTAELKKSLIAELGAEIKKSIPAQAPVAPDELKQEIMNDVVGNVMGVLQSISPTGVSQAQNGGAAPAQAAAPAPEAAPAADVEPAPAVAAPDKTESVFGGAIEVPIPERYAADKQADITAFPIPKEEAGEVIERVVLGATAEEGGTRDKTLVLGGQNCLPGHYFEGDIPTAPAFALSVFDSIGEKTSPVLRETWGDLLERPAEMAKKCVDEYGADAICVRLEGTHPERGGKSPAEGLVLVKEVLAAVDVPLIVSAHSHFESANEVLKTVAAGCDGERLLLNWVEGDNYRTIAGVALAYGHCVVAQSSIDVNLAKQLNILLTNMDLPRDRIVMDPMTGALGYGLEYTFSVMERIRVTALGGDSGLNYPMVTFVGQEAWKVKEASASEADFPEWGNLAKRGVLWEVQTAMPLILAGSDLTVLNHPESLIALRRNVAKLCGHAKPETKES